MSDNKERELTSEELEGVTGGKAAQRDTHKGMRTPFDPSEGPKDHVIDPDPGVEEPPYGSDQRSKK